MSKTFPREIIKWIQSLDLSYSLKDSKRDLNNGYLIAEIFVRYYPHDLSMHSFDNSENTAKKKNNWLLLSKYFEKNKKLGFKPDEYNRIADGDFAQLVQFMARLYNVLTKRAATMNPYGVSQEIMLPEPEKTERYLLTGKGMEKLELPGSNKDNQDAGSKKAAVSSNRKIGNTRDGASPGRQRAGPADGSGNVGFAGFGGNRDAPNRDTRKSHNMSVGDSHNDGVGFELFLENRGWRWYFPDQQHARRPQCNHPRSTRTRSRK